MTNIRYGWFIGPGSCFDSADQENSLISLTVCIAKRGIHMDIDGLEGTRVAEMIYRGRVVFFKSTISKNQLFKNILLKMHSASLLHMDIDGIEGSRVAEMIYNRRLAPPWGIGDSKSSESKL